MLNKTLILNSRPSGKPVMENFRIEEKNIKHPGNGEVLIKGVYYSVDPYMRGRMRDVKSYIEPFKTGEAIEGGVAGRVIESNSALFEEGDLVFGEHLPFQEYITAETSSIEKIVDISLNSSLYLGLFGMPGLTAYFGLFDIGRPVKGETVVISGAAGAVGSLAGQLAKLSGCRVIGIAGTDEKCEFLKDELNFDGAVNYRKGNFRKNLKDVCPEGVDIYFDNVGGTITESVITLIRENARIILCGQISQYNLSRPEPGMRPYLYLIVRRALMKGFIVYDYKDRYAEARNDLISWYKEGKIKYRETIIDDFESIPEAFFGLFDGKNTGKMLVKI